MGSKREQPQYRLWDRSYFVLGPKRVRSRLFIRFPVEENEHLENEMEQRWREDTNLR